MLIIITCFLRKKRGREGGRREKERKGERNGGRKKERKRGRKKPSELSLVTDLKMVDLVSFFTSVNYYPVATRIT